MKKTQILEYAGTNKVVTANGLSKMYGINLSTARQYLSTLAKENKLIRIGRGEYSLKDKQSFIYTPFESVKEIYGSLKRDLPFTDFCIYEGSILSSIQHHLFINKAIYVETNRDAVRIVFEHLKNKYKNVYRQPDAEFMQDYIDLREKCIIVKPLVTESPLMTVDGIKVPTLEKILVDTQKDTDFDYLQGAESAYIFQQAFDLYSINTRRLKRYSKRRNINKKINTLIQQAQ